MALPLKVAFAGTPELAATILEFLLGDDRFDITCVLTQPDRAAGRGRKIRKSPVKLLAEARGISVHQPEKPADIDSNLLDELDVMVVAAYGLIIPASILQKPAMGCVNVHTSLLPRWRGAAPIQRAIEAGDKVSGITIMQMDRGLDTGDILLQASTPVNDDDTAGTLHDRLALLGAEVLAECLGKMADGSVVARQQDDSKSCYAGKISRAEAEIDWQRPAQEIERKIRAFNPVPVCFTQLNGVEMRIWEAEVRQGPGSHLLPGTVLDGGNGGFDVVCGEQALRVIRLQLPGKKAVHVDEFLNGHHSFLAPRAVP